MTKKHFEALALGLASVRPNVWADSPVNEDWQACVNVVSDTCEMFNPHFDRDRFMDACRTYKTGIRGGNLVRVKS
jgi:hypothetical protein